MEDGLVLLKKHLSVDQVMHLIEQTAMWPDPETFALLPVWFPEHARGAPFYKANWSAEQGNTNRRTGVTVHKHESNTYANKALEDALGLTKKDKQNWSCCHIWGVDDPENQLANTIVQDPRYYSCLANVVLLPTPLKAFTDAMPEVKQMLRLCVKYTYGWVCEHPDVAKEAAEIDAAGRLAAYPASWPMQDRPDARPIGIVPITDKIRRLAARRRQRIADDLVYSGEYYPKTVPDVLQHWNIVLPAADRNSKRAR